MKCGGLDKAEVSVGMTRGRWVAEAFQVGREGFWPADVFGGAPGGGAPLVGAAVLQCAAILAPYGRYR